ncbi:LptA/OstA family protein [Pectinatus sottacetonis]|uniref:LptA/OstA family protein n=1 Tax=Pectinatus sottacetonis TaxID=1002795 RepID=UPI0018C7781C|nr:LptA/OstA family protein [Pectinatus sottacetonis]
MKKMTNKFKIAVITVVYTFIICVGTVFAAENKATEVNADTIEYNMQTGVINAMGNVVMMQNGARISGTNAVYNTKTQQGSVTGNVVADKGNMHMTANEVFTQGADNIVASGNVRAHQLDKTLIGSKLEYNSKTDYAIMPSGGKIISKDGTITGNTLEAYMDSNHFIAAGNVHIVSQTRNIEAYSDNADYYSDASGKIVLNGNAVAMQDNNTIKGDKLTLYLDDNGNAAIK